MVRTIRRILVEHEGTSGLDLGIENGIPKLLSLDGALRSAFGFVLEEESVEFSAVCIRETWRLRWAEQRPVPISFDTSHAIMPNDVSDRRRFQDDDTYNISGIQRA